MDDFFNVNVRKTTVLDPDEIVTEIRIPAPAKGSKSAFIKFALRKSIDFPIVNCAAALTMSGDIVAEARICLNAVYVTPYRATAAEDIHHRENGERRAYRGDSGRGGRGRKTDDAQQVLVQIARTLVKRTLAACR